jgi:arabinan endo-1,5-alpha-L-arabinosidase
VADHPLGPYRNPEGGHEALLMRSRPGAVIGPGHNSFTTSPDGSETWIVYHAWDVAQTTRRMCIDRLGWEGDRPVTAGPSSGPQAAPSARYSAERGG